MAKKKKPSFKNIQKLFDAINGGDCVDSAVEAQSLLEAFIMESHDVIENWESGDLAGAVTRLAQVLKAAEGK